MGTFNHIDHCCGCLRSQMFQFLPVTVAPCPLPPVFSCFQRDVCAVALFMSWKWRSKVSTTEEFVTARHSIPAWRIGWSFFAGSVGSWVISSIQSYLSPVRLKRLSCIHIILRCFIGPVGALHVFFLNWPSFQIAFFEDQPEGGEGGAQCRAPGGPVGAVHTAFPQHRRPNFGQKKCEKKPLWVGNGLFFLSFLEHPRPAKKNHHFQFPKKQFLSQKSLLGHFPPYVHWYKLTDTIFSGTQNSKNFEIPPVG